MGTCGCPVKRAAAKVAEPAVGWCRYFEREKACQQPLYAWRCVNSRVAQATGLSPRTIQRIREAEKKRPPGQPIVKKIRKKSTGRPSTLKESDRFHISNTLDNMQRSKEPVTLAKLKTKLDASGLVISRSTLARIIQKMGFRYTPSRSEKGKAHEEREKNEERGAWSRDQSAKEKWEKEMHQRIKQQAEREAASSHSAQHAVNSQLPVHVQQPVRNEQSAIHTHGGGSGRVELDDDQHGYLREFGHEEDSVDGASDRSDEMQLGNFLREFGQEAVTTAYGAGGNHS